MTLYPNVYVATCLQVVVMVKYDAHCVLIRIHEPSCNTSTVKVVRISFTRRASHETFQSR